MAQIQNKDFSLDPAATERALQYERFGFSAARDTEAKLKKTMRACYPERFGAEK